MGLNVKFKKPVPLNDNLKVVCRLTKDGSRLFEAEGEIILEDGKTAVSAKGKYIKLSLEKITKEEFIDDQWFKDINSDDPQTITIG